MYQNQHADTKSPVKSQTPSVTSCVEKPQHLKDIRVLGRKDAEPNLSVTELELLTAVSSHDLSTASSIADDCGSVSPGRLRRKEVLLQASLTSSSTKALAMDWTCAPPADSRPLQSRPTMDSRRPKKTRPPKGNLEKNSGKGDERKAMDMGSPRADAPNNKEKQRRWCVRAGLEARQTPAYCESHASAFCRPYSSPTPSLGSRSRDQRSPSNMYVFLNPNIHVKTPFKHNIHKPRDAEKTKLKSPSQNLKELTAAATYHVSRILAAYSGNEPVQPTGHLLKGRLKPMYPVVVTGPKIEHCRGILSETRSYFPSASRTFQRRRQIMMQLKSGDRHFSSLSLCQQKGYDSVHRVSAASSAEDWVSNSGEEKESVEDDGDAEIEINEKETCEIMLKQL
ncbi:hypothetical protein C0Q70_17309 [Pomacea canaliculata]|uniref:Uncharacterized protein n=1 Tax=Pomacea canaliculata TaxID=400727 RepID=A0A2T7NK26_POMCA|nr:hypothetical protein C0Q70_17309 [Pomacea canaliculata]